MRSLTKTLKHVFLLSGSILTAHIAVAQVPVIDLNQGQGAGYSAPSRHSNESYNNPSLSLEQQVKILQQQVTNLTQMDLPGKIDSIQQQVQDLNGKLEVQAHNIQTLTDQQKSFYQDLNQRLIDNQTIKGSTGTAGTPATSGGIAKAQTEVAQNIAPPDTTPAPTPAPTLTSPANASGEEKAYQTAFNLVIKKKNPEAITAFQAFLTKYPKSKRAPNVHYWLGELYSAQNKNDLAKQQLNLLITQYPNDEKAPDAMLKLAIIEDQNGEHENAIRMLREIIQKYPNSNAARLANVRLKQMMTTA